MGYLSHYDKLSSFYLMLCRFVDEYLDTTEVGRPCGDRWSWFGPAPTRDELQKMSTKALSEVKKGLRDEAQAIIRQVNADHGTVSVLAEGASWIDKADLEKQQKWLKDMVDMREYLRNMARHYETKIFA